MKSGVKAAESLSPTLRDMALKSEKSSEHLGLAAGAQSQLSVDERIQQRLLRKNQNKYITADVSKNPAALLSLNNPLSPTTHLSQTPAIHSNAHLSALNEHVLTTKRVLPVTDLNNTVKRVIG